MGEVELIWHAARKKIGSRALARTLSGFGTVAVLITVKLPGTPAAGLREGLVRRDAIGRKPNRRADYHGIIHA
jgi:hypothetical protein